MIELIQLFDNDDDLFAATSTPKSQFNKLDIFKSVKNEQAFWRLFKGQRRVKLRFGDSSQAEVIARTLAQVFLHHRALLINLHRVNTHMCTLVFIFANGP